MITNIVCHADLECSINLKDLTSKCVNIIYDPSKFPAAIWKHKTIGGTCMVFSKVINFPDISSVANLLSEIVTTQSEFVIRM